MVDHEYPPFRDKKPSLLRDRSSHRGRSRRYKRTTGQTFQQVGGSIMTTIKEKRGDHRVRQMKFDRGAPSSASGFGAGNTATTTTARTAIAVTTAALTLQLLYAIFGDMKLVSATAENEFLASRDFVPRAAHHFASTYPPDDAGTEADGVDRGRTSFEDEPSTSNGPAFSPAWYGNAGSDVGYGSPIVQFQLRGQNGMGPQNGAQHVAGTNPPSGTAGAAMQPFYNRSRRRGAGGGRAYGNANASLARGAATSSGASSSSAASAPAYVIRDVVERMPPASVQFGSSITRTTSQSPFVFPDADVADPGGSLWQTQTQTQIAVGGSTTAPNSSQGPPPHPQPNGDSDYPSLLTEQSAVVRAFPEQQAVTFGSSTAAASRRERAAASTRERERSVVATPPPPARERPRGPSHRTTITTASSASAGAGPPPPGPHVTGVTRAPDLPRTRSVRMMVRSPRRGWRSRSRSATRPGSSRGRGPRPQRSPSSPRHDFDLNAAWHHDNFYAAEEAPPERPRRRDQRSRSPAPPPHRRIRRLGDAVRPRVPAIPTSWAKPVAKPAEARRPRLAIGARRDNSAPPVPPHDDSDASNSTPSADVAAPSSIPPGPGPAPRTATDADLNRAGLAWYLRAHEHFVGDELWLPPAATPTSPASLPPTPSAGGESLLDPVGDLAEPMPSTQLMQAVQLPQEQRQDDAQQQAAVAPTTPPPANRSRAGAPPTPQAPARRRRHLRRTLSEAPETPTAVLMPTPTPSRTTTPRLTSGLVVVPEPDEDEQTRTPGDDDEVRASAASGDSAAGGAYAGDAHADERWNFALLMRMLRERAPEEPGPARPADSQTGLQSGQLPSSTTNYLIHDRSVVVSGETGGGRATGTGTGTGTLTLAAAEVAAEAPRPLTLPPLPPALSAIFGGSPSSSGARVPPFPPLPRQHALGSTRPPAPPTGGPNRTRSSNFSTPPQSAAGWSKLPERLEKWLGNEFVGEKWTQDYDETKDLLHTLVNSTVGSSGCRGCGCSSCMIPSPGVGREVEVEEQHHGQKWKKRKIEEGGSQNFCCEAVADRRTCWTQEEKAGVLMPSKSSATPASCTICMEDMQARRFHIRLVHDNISSFQGNRSTSSAKPKEDAFSVKIETKTTMLVPAEGQNGVRCNAVYCPCVFKAHPARGLDDIDSYYRASYDAEMVWKRRPECVTCRRKMLFVSGLACCTSPNLKSAAPTSASSPEQPATRRHLTAPGSSTSATSSSWPPAAFYAEPPWRQQRQQHQQQALLQPRPPCQEISYFSLNKAVSEQLDAHIKEKLQLRKTFQEYHEDDSDFPVIHDNGALTVFWDQDAVVEIEDTEHDGDAASNGKNGSLRWVFLSELVNKISAVEKELYKVLLNATTTSSYLSDDEVVAQRIHHLDPYEATRTKLVNIYQGRLTGIQKLEYVLARAFEDPGFGMQLELVTAPEISSTPVVRSSSSPSSPSTSTASTATGSSASSGGNSSSGSSAPSRKSDPPTPSCTTTPSTRTFYRTFTHDEYERRMPPQLKSNNPASEKERRTYAQRVDLLRKLQIRDKEIPGGAAVPAHAAGAPPRLRGSVAQRQMTVGRRNLPASFRNRANSTTFNVQ